jgi:hypothetical protein
VRPATFLLSATMTTPAPAESPALVSSSAEDGLPATPVRQPGAVQVASSNGEAALPSAAEPPSTPTPAVRQTQSLQGSPVVTASLSAVSVVAPPVSVPTTPGSQAAPSVGPQWALPGLTASIHEGSAHYKRDGPGFKAAFGKRALNGYAAVGSGPKDSSILLLSSFPDGNTTSAVHKLLENAGADPSKYQTHLFTCFSYLQAASMTYFSWRAGAVLRRTICKACCWSIQLARRYALCCNGSD